jgi:hypothetical protein
MDYLDKEKFGEYFCTFYCDEQFHTKQSYQACLRLESIMEELISQGFTIYKAVMKMCKDVHISFDILLQLNHVITIRTYVNAKEWSKNTFQGNRYEATKFLANELSALLYVRYQNIIFIEDASK